MGRRDKRPEELELEILKKIKCARECGSTKNEAAKAFGMTPKSLFYYEVKHGFKTKPEEMILWSR